MSGPFAPRRLAVFALAWALLAAAGGVAGEMVPGRAVAAAASADSAPAEAPAAGAGGVGGEAAPQASPLAVRLLPQAEVSGPVVRLGDVARLVEGDGAAFEALSSIPVGTAPLPGEVRTLSRGQIELRLRQARVNPQRLRWAGETSLVEVRRAAARVPEAAIVQRIDAYLNSPAAAGEGSGPAVGPSGTGLRVAAVEDCPPLFMPPGDVEIRVVSAPPVLRPGSAVFAVELRHGSGMVRRAWVRVRLEGDAGLRPVAARREFPALREPAAHPERSPAAPATGVPRGAASQGAGSQPVVLVARRGAVWVESDGVLLEDGPVGSVVRVLSAATGRVVRGVRVAPGRVEALGEAAADG